MVEGGGFEPPKAEPADLQSAPFGHLGTPPQYVKEHRNTPGIPTGYPLDILGCLPRVSEYPIGAGDGTRTRNLLITNQLLYQLSYASDLAI
jgi:hypothetical protein